MAITKVINDAVDLNQTSDYSGLRLPVGTTGNVVESFTTDYLVVGGGGGGGQGYYGGGGGAGGLRTSYNNSTTTTNSLSFPSGKTAVATYMLNNNANDVSGNYNGTETNITYNTGKYGGAAVFNGSSSYIDLGTSIATSTRAVSMWVYAYDFSERWPFQQGDGQGVENYIRFYNTDDIQVRWGNVTQTFSGYSANTWYHIVAQKDSNNNANVWINGVEMGSTGTPSAIAVNKTQIGTRYNNNSYQYYFNGLIDQVRIYNTALDSTDVSNIYNNEAQANSGGGAIAESSLTLSEGVAYDVTVGSGAPGGNTQSGTADNGNNSIFSTITSNGGGGGQNRAGSFGSDGGSGGGAAIPLSAGGNGTLNQGYAGGSLPAAKYGSGGGGASEIGLIPLTNYNQSPQRNSLGAPGGDGLSVSITGTATYYSGGGGGGARNPGPDAGTSGGLGGGGDGGEFAIGEDGSYNTGGGGGGGGFDADNGGNGGSGVVILRYPTASVSSFTTTGTLNTPSTTNTLADNNYPVTNTAYYTLDGNANGYLTTTDLSTVNYPAGAGCIALYELNGNANDTSNTYNGLANNITYNTGAFDQAAVFNGSSSYIDLGTSLLGSRSAFSVSTWVNFSNLNTQNFIFFTSESGTGGNVGFYDYGNGNIYFQPDASTSANRGYISNSGIYTTDEWVHIVMVFDGSATGNSNRLKAYIQGTERTLTYDGTIPSSSGTSTANSWIGGRSSTKFSGDIDQVRIFNTALTQAQVTTLARGVGTAYNGTASNVTWRNGRFGQAAFFNGSNSGIFISSTGTSVTDYDQDFSISCWFRFDDGATGGNQNYLFMGGGTENVQMFVTSSYGVRFQLYNSGAVYRVSTGAISTGVFYHVVATRSKTDGLKIYLDSVEKDTDSYTGNANPALSGKDSIGQYFDGTRNNFEGLIDQVRIFSTALSSSQVTQLYNEHYQTKFTDGSDTAIVFTEGTGTVTFSGVDPAPPQGALRTNTSYSEDGSASVIEHYNGTDWKRFDAIKYCTTNTLNFPSGAGCIASYNLDNNVNDIGNTYNGVNSNVTFNASGKFGAAAVFNGSNSRIDISNVLSGFTNVYSFSIWAKIDNTNNFSFLSSTTSTASSTYNNLIRFALHQNGNYYFSFGDIYGARLTGTSPSSWTNNNWHNFVFVSTPTQKLVYVDGSLFDSASSTKAVSGLTNIILGHYGTNYADGLMDQVRIFNDSLSSDEVLKLYNNEIACS